MNTFIKVKLLPYVRDSLEDKSILLHFKMLSLLFHLGTHLKEELTAYWFVLKATRVFPIATQAEKTEGGEHFANN